MTKAIHILATAEAIYGLLKPYIPAEPKAEKPKAGRPSLPTETKLHVVVNKLKTGLPWKDLGPNGNAAFRYFQALEKAEALPAILQAIVAHKDLIGFSQDGPHPTKVPPGLIVGVPILLARRFAPCYGPPAVVGLAKKTHATSPQALRRYGRSTTRGWLAE